MTSVMDQLSSWQQTLLVVLRFCVGWHLFFQGYGKLQAVSWTAAGYLSASTGPFSSLFQVIPQWPEVQCFVDAVTICGLMILGIFLMVGLFTQSAALVAFGLLMTFYLAAPPLAYGGFIIETPEGTELYVNKTLLEALVVLLLLSFPTGGIVGLDLLVDAWKARRREGRRGAEPVSGDQEITS